jgi:hypothetical protein
MTDEQMRKLTALQNYGTRYEAVVIRGDGERRRLGYLGRHSRRGLSAALNTCARDVIAFLGVPETARVKAVGAWLAIDGGATVEFSGRTQREAITAGELPYIAS